MVKLKGANGANESKTSRSTRETHFVHTLVHVCPPWVLLRKRRPEHLGRVDPSKKILRHVSSLSMASLQLSVSQARLLRAYLLLLTSAGKRSMRISFKDEGTWAMVNCRILGGPSQAEKLRAAFHFFSRE